MAAYSSIPEYDSNKSTSYSSISSYSSNSNKNENLALSENEIATANSDVVCENLEPVQDSRAF